MPGLHRTTGQPDDEGVGDIRRILEENSVKDIQEMEDKKFVMEVDVLVATEKNK